MRYPDPRDPSHVFAHVRDKIRDRQGFSESSLRVDTLKLVDEDPWKIDIVLTESPDDLAARFIKKDHDV